VKAVSSQYERLGELAVKLDDINTFASSAANLPATPNTV